MKKILTLLLTALLATVCNAKPKPQETKPMNTNSKTAVVYFSATGTTKRVAQNLAQAIGADLHEIKPLAPYSSTDLDWTNKSSRSSVEMNDTSSRPALAASDFSVKEYDKVFLGFPIWWGTAPRVVQTFLEGQDFANKTIILFATSGSSGMGNTDKDLKSSVSASTKIVKGKTLNSNPSVEELKKWVAIFL